MARRSQRSERVADPAPPPSAPTAALDLRGSIDGIGRDGRLGGWAWSSDEPDARRRVLILADGIRVAETVADSLRADLAAAGVGDGAHGFYVDIPESVLRPGLSVRFAMQDLASGRQVGGDLVIEVPPEDAPKLTSVPAGNLDQVTGDGWVTGWCWYPADPEQRVELAVLANGAEVGRTVAEDFRGDLEREGVGDGRHGFTYALPWQVLSSSGEITVTVRDAATRQQVGAAVTVRIGAQVETEDRVAGLERQVRMLRSELESYTRQAAARDEDRAARDLFRTVGAFFAELAESPSPGSFVGAGLRGAIAAFADAHSPLVLAIPASPKATILIGGAPASAAYRCIAALQAAGADSIADFVVVDDGSEGGQAALLPTVVRNLRYHRTGAATDSAFGGLSEAAREARAPIVVCLSPDVVPQARMVEMLVETFAQEPEAAIVGTRVLRADGTLEYAEAELSADFVLGRSGSGAASDAPDLAFLRPVDVVDARAFAIRRDVRTSVGLFATREAAMIDLCIGARSDGRTVLLQPAAVVVLAPEAGPPRSADAADLSQLRLRWRTGAPRPQRFVGHALVVDTELPRPDRDAGSVVTFEFMQVLRSLGWRVTFAPANGAFDDGSIVADLERRGIGFARPPRYSSITAFLQEQGAGLDLALVFRHAHAGLLIERIRDLAPRARFVFAPADLHFLREERRAALIGGPISIETRRQELTLAREADATIVHSDHERDLLAAELGAERLHLLRWIADPIAEVAPFERRRGVCFVGAFQHDPNVDAVTWFAEAVLPLVRAQARTSHFTSSGPMRRRR